MALTTCLCVEKLCVELCVRSTYVIECGQCITTHSLLICLQTLGDKDKMAAQIDLETKRKLHEMDIQVGNNKEGVRDICSADFVDR